MFKQDQEVYDNLYSSMGCVRVNIVGKCKVDTFHGAPQIIVDDFEIVDRQEYYF
jgi:hypothetical protein